MGNAHSSATPNNSITSHIWWCLIIFCHHHRVGGDNFAISLQAECALQYPIKKLATLQHKLEQERAQLYK